MAGVISVLKDFISEHRTLAGSASVVGLGAAVVVFVKRFPGNKYNRKCGVDYPADTVIVQVGASAGKHVPTIGHFCLKLMTYLRAAGIPYNVSYASLPMPKNKVPWIEYNGTALGDSHMIMQFLNKEFNKNLNSTLSKEQRGLAWAIQKWIEEFTYWMSVHTRWILYRDEFLNNDLNSNIQSGFLKAYLTGYIRKMTYMVGIGRHTKEEISDMICFDLRQFSAILGKEMYLMGSKITEVDCAAFGILGQIYFQSPHSCKGRQLLRDSDEFKNVREYLERIKTRFWPDWNECCMKE